MGSSAKHEYCAFTKAVEHLGDRWSLLIVREVAMFGPQGFNTLVASLPGRISRSVLAAKLRKLEEIGLIARAGGSRERAAPYVLTPAGEQLVPTMMSLWKWAERWVPEDPAMAQRDPSVILWWLTHRVGGTRPGRQVAIEFALNIDGADREWLLVSPGAEPELCLTDPDIGEENYVFVEADAAALYPLARGQRAWSEAITDGSVRLYGDPALVAALPSWFLAPAEAQAEREPAASLAV